MPFSLDPSKVTPEQMIVARQQAVELIYERVWLGNSPPAWAGKGWTLARELSVWNRLAKQYGPVQVNGAMTVFREALGIPPTKRWSLVSLANNQKQHYIRRCIDQWEKTRSQDGHLRAVGDILRRAVES